MESVKIQRYPAYKDSGTEWLGEVPEHWKVTKVKNVFRLVMEPSPKNNDFELLSVYTDIGVKPRKELEERGNKASTTDGYWFVKKGDIVVNKLLAWMGAIGVSNYDGVTSPAYDILRAKVQLESNFYHYLFRNGACVSELKKHSRGIMDMRLRLYFDKFGDVMIPFPDYSEQQKIVSFLDRKTSLIDQAIGIKEKQIELLKERRQILIHRTVTRGLNPNVKLKDSGVEWMGEIPEHWSQKKNGNLARIIRGASPRPAGHPMYFDGTDIPWIAVGDITRDENVYLNTAVNFLTEAGKRQSRFIEKGVFVLTNSGATLGVPKIMNLSGCINDGVLAFIDLKENVIDKLFLYYYYTSQTIRLRNEMNQGATQPNLNTSIIKQLPIAVPPIKEQNEIVEYIKNFTTKIAAAISLKEKEIEKLKEYKASLINEAVTGKIKVC